MRAREAAGQVPRVPRGPLNGVGGGAVGQEQARGAWESAAAGGEQRGRQRRIPELMVMGLVQSSNRPIEEEAEANRSPIEEEAEEVCVLCVCVPRSLCVAFRQPHFWHLSLRNDIAKTGTDLNH